MATIYKIKIKTVSPFLSYSEDQIKEIVTKLLGQYQDKTTGLKFESTEVEVTKI